MSITTSSRVRLARTGLSAALLATSLALPAHAGLLGGGGGFGSIGGNLGGSLGPRGLDVAGQGSAQKQLQAPPVKEQTGEAAQAGADQAGRRAQDARTNLGERARGATEASLGATGSATAKAQKTQPAAAAEPAAAPGQGTTPAPTTQPSRQVQAGGNAKVSKQDRTLDAEASGDASVQR